MIHVGDHAWVQGSWGQRFGLEGLGVILIRTYVCMHGCVCNDPSVEAMKLKVKAKGKHKPLQHDTPESAVNGAESANAVVVQQVIPQSVLILFFCFV